MELDVIDAVQIRLDDHHRRLTDLEQTRPAVIAQQMRDTRDDVNEIKKSIEKLDAKIDDRAGSMVKALYVAAVSFAASTVGLSLTAYLIWGSS